MADNSLDCPVDFVTINEYRARLVAFFVGSLGLWCFLSPNVVIAAFLLGDFALRAFNWNTYSPLAIVSGWLLKLFRIKPKPVDRAPKRFAACMGLGFLTIITVSLLANFITVAKAALMILMIFAALESLAGFCAGCHVYSFLKRFGVIK